MNIKQSLDTIRKSLEERRSLDEYEYEEEEPINHHQKMTKVRFLLLSLNSLGVIFGDIGTSPLYVLNTIFPKGKNMTNEDILGACSLILYTIVIVVAIKYIIFVLLADNNGEGGVFSLCSLLIGRRSSVPTSHKKFIIVVCLIGAAMLFGDGAITPAISVLSAIEGLAIASNGSFDPYIVPITIIIIVILFCVQPLGTAKVGLSFGPIMLLWFISLFSIGIYNITFMPSALYAINPYSGVKFFINNGVEAYFALGSVFLSVTGLEALYADLGHFGAGPVRLSWLAVVMPSVMLNYIGQTAVLMADNSKAGAIFFNSIPKPLYWPMFVLAILAGIIASQAIITGSFSLISQAVQLEFAPPLSIKHTSKVVKGQIYIPSINFTIMILAIAIVAGMRTSEAVSHMYGVTVCTDMILTTTLYILVMKFTWKSAVWKICLFALFYIIDIAFWTSILTKIPRGGWIALVIAFSFFIVMFIWFIGERHLNRFLKQNNTSTRLRHLVDRFEVYGGDEKAMISHISAVGSKKKKNISSSSSESSYENEANNKSNLKNVEVSNDASSSSYKHSYSPSEENNPEKDKSSMNKDIEVSEDNSEIMEKKKRKSKQSTRESIQSRGTYSKESEKGYLPNTNKQRNWKVKMPHGEEAVTVAPLPGMGVFITSSKVYTPMVFENFISRMHGIQDIVVFLKVKNVDVPSVREDSRIEVKSYGNNIYLVVASYGYAEGKYNLHQAIMLAERRGLPQIPFETTTYFTSAVTIKVINKSWFWRWFLYVYAFIKGNFFAVGNKKLPVTNTITVGVVVTL